MAATLLKIWGSSPSARSKTAMASRIYCIRREDSCQMLAAAPPTRTIRSAEGSRLSSFSRFREDQPHPDQPVAKGSIVHRLAAAAKVCAGATPDFLANLAAPPERDQE